MSQDKIIIGKENPVSIEFEFKGGTITSLNDFDDISATFGEDTRTLLLNATSVKVISDTQLDLLFGDTDERLVQFWEIFGTIGSDKIDLTSECLNNLNQTSVCP